MPTMKAWLRCSLAFLALAGPALAATTAANSTAKPAAPSSTKPATRPALTSTLTVHRCTNARGQVTLQGDPCPPGSREQTFEMTRPKDPPKSPSPAAAILPPPTPVVQQEPNSYQAPELIPPPPMYRCTSYDGIERFSESYDPNPRCEPFVLYLPYPNNLPPDHQLACRWVEDSCVRLSDNAACARWKAMRVQARSAVLHAFSDTAAYRKSELERLDQIVEESCP
jgi:hypothetical protein